MKHVAEMQHSCLHLELTVQLNRCKHKTFNSNFTVQQRLFTKKQNERTFLSDTENVSAFRLLHKTITV